MKHQAEIKDMLLAGPDGETYQGFYLVQRPQVRTTANGSRFLTLTLWDTSAQIPAVLWDDVEAPDEGSIVKVRGIVDEYDGSPQFKISHLRKPAEGDTVPLEKIVPCAYPGDKLAEATAAVEATVKSIATTELRMVASLCWQKYSDAFSAIPGGKSVHHNRLNGLLQHTANMLMLAEKVAEIYSPLVDRDLLLAGTLLHDLGKIQEFQPSDIGLVKDYSLDGNLFGHLVLGIEMIDQVCAEYEIPTDLEDIRLLKHLIASHHGDLDKGALATPAIMEAELLHQLDMLDSRADIYCKAIVATEPGCWSQYIPALSHKVYRPEHGALEKQGYVYLPRHDAQEKQGYTVPGDPA